MLRGIELDLWKNYNIIFVSDKLQDMIMQCKFIMWRSAQSQNIYLYKHTEEPVNPITKEDILKTIDIFLKKN